MMEDNNMISDIERLVKAQNDVDLVKEVALVNGQSFDYEVDSNENGRQLGKMLTPPRPAMLTVKTLAGFLDAIAAQVIGGNMTPTAADSKPVFPTDGSKCEYET